MPGKTRLQRLVVVTGLAGSGKSTVLRLLVDALLVQGFRDLLVCDFSPDQGLVRAWGAARQPTLGETAAKLLAKPHRDRETLDWVFENLAVTSPEYPELDLLAGGALPETLSPEVQEDLLFGFSRLMAGYGLCLWEGLPPQLGILADAFPSLILQVVTPEHEPLDLELPTSILLNRVHPGEAPSSGVQEALNSGYGNLVGRLPDVPGAGEAVIDALEAPFEDIFYRLDLPFCS